MKNLIIARPGRRFLAFVIDLILSIPVLFLPYAFLSVWMVSKYGGSLGKLIMGLRIVDMEGKYLSTKHSFYREFMGNIVSSTLFPISYLFMFFDQNRQTWHDMIVDSYVVTKS